MSKFIIEGGIPLQGTVTPSGNKNAALKLLPACLLTDEPVILHNIPDIQDVRFTIEIMADLGVDITDLGNGSWRFHAENISKTELDSEIAGHTRASFVFSGPMLARFGQVTLPLPGGDVIGGRPLDTHIRALESMGVAVVMRNRGVFHMNADPLHGGGYLLLAEASVTATENSVMAAVKAARFGALAPHLKASHIAIGSINSPMQCMMKEICAQCLQQHVDPESGQKSVVFSCFNQDQPLDRVDFDVLNQRLGQNALQEKLTRLWIAHTLGRLDRPLEAV